MKLRSFLLSWPLSPAPSSLQLPPPHPLLHSGTEHCTSQNLCRKKSLKILFKSISNYLSLPFSESLDKDLKVHKKLLSWWCKKKLWNVWHKCWHIFHISWHTLRYIKCFKAWKSMQLPTEIMFCRVKPNRYLRKIWKI